jgi:hypothetical protein
MVVFHRAEECGNQAVSLQLSTRAFLEVHIGFVDEKDGLPLFGKRKPFGEFAFHLCFIGTCLSVNQICQHTKSEHIPISAQVRERSGRPVIIVSRDIREL